MVELQEKYLDILRALEAGTRKSKEIQSECNLGDTFQCSNALAILVRMGLIVHGYGLTEAGKTALGKPVQYSVEPTLGARMNKSMPPRPDDHFAPPGFTWVFDNTQWKWVPIRKGQRIPERAIWG
jgi:hypothetical protein